MTAPRCTNHNEICAFRCDEFRNGWSSFAFNDGRARVAEAAFLQPKRHGFLRDRPGLLPPPVARFLWPELVLERIHSMNSSDADPRTSQSQSEPHCTTGARRK